MDSEAARDVFGMLIDAMVADGAGVLKLLYAPDRWAGYPRRSADTDEPAETFLQRAERFKKSARFPLAWRDVDITTFYPLEGEDGLEACLEIAERPRHLVQRRYGLITDKRSGRLVPAGGDSQPMDGSGTQPEAPNTAPRATARVVEYWDDEYFAYLVDGHLVRRGRHGYGAIPYVHAYGDQTPSRDPAKAGVSMLASMEYLIPLLDQLLTMKQNALFLYAYPTPKITNFSPLDPSLSNDGRPRALDFRPGEILPLYQGEDLTFLQWQGTPPDLDELIAQTRAMIDQAGAPSVLFGVPPDGNTSGYLLNQLINTARVSFQQVARHAEQALERSRAADVAAGGNAHRRTRLRLRGRGRPRLDRPGDQTTSTATTPCACDSIRSVPLMTSPREPWPPASSAPASPPAAGPCAKSWASKTPKPSKTKSSSTN